MSFLCLLLFIWLYTSSYFYDKHWPPQKSMNWKVISLSFALKSNKCVTLNLINTYIHTMKNVFILRFFVQYIELTTFLLVLIVFLLAYGVARHSLLYGQTEPSWNILGDILFHPYWQLYGELSFDDSMKSKESLKELGE